MREYRIIDAWKLRGKNAGNGSISSGGTVHDVLLRDILRKRNTKLMLLEKDFLIPVVVVSDGTG